jgi:hypothetical protein
MSDFLDNWYDNCLDQAPNVAHAFGIVSGGAAAAPFAAATAGETFIPPAWGVGQTETAALGAVAFEGGKQLGEFAGDVATHGYCSGMYETGNGVEHAYDWAHDQLWGPGSTTTPLPEPIPSEPPAPVIFDSPAPEPAASTSTSTSGFFSSWDAPAASSSSSWADTSSHSFDTGSHSFDTVSTSFDSGSVGSHDSVGSMSVGSDPGSAI